MTAEWTLARRELDREVLAAVRRFERATGCTLSLEIKYRPPMSSRQANGAADAEAIIWAALDGDDKRAR